MNKPLSLKTSRSEKRLTPNTKTGKHFEER